MKCFNQSFLIYWLVEPILEKPCKTRIKIQVEFRKYQLAYSKEDKPFLTQPHNFSSLQTPSQYTHSNS